MCVWVVAQLPQRLNETFFEIISSIQVPFGELRMYLSLDFFQKTLILTFEENSALS